MSEENLCPTEEELLTLYIQKHQANIPESVKRDRQMLSEFLDLSRALSEIVMPTISQIIRTQMVDSQHLRDTICHAIGALAVFVYSTGMKESFLKGLEMCEKEFPGEN